MRLSELEFDLPCHSGEGGLIDYFAAHPQLGLVGGAIPLRFVVTHTIDGHYHCEAGLLTRGRLSGPYAPQSIFTFRPRKFENQERFAAVMLVPTGIGAIVGGHAGDAAPAARLLAACADR